MMQEAQRRPLDDLSQGTRDSFLFAARLALSVRAAPGGGLLFDEPFLSLDADREDRALRMLAEFPREGWAADHYLHMTPDAPSGPFTAHATSTSASLGSSAW
jgi:ABC-type Mn2+/Zn2+ transport system ATPase subunit